MLWKLLLAMTVIPAVELFILLQLGSLIGPLETFLIIVVTGTIGAFLAKREGLGVLTTLKAELAQGLPPGSRLAEGVLVLAGGLFLLTPGVLTDLAGFLFIAPPSRRWLAPRLVRWVVARVDFVQVGSETHDSFYEGEPTVRPRQRPRVRQGHPGESPFSSPFDDLP